MFNFFHRVLFALSSASPMLVVAAFVAYFEGQSELVVSALVILGALLLFFAGGVGFLRTASSHGELIPVKGRIASVSPSGQWLPVLFGSYLIPLISLLEQSLNLEHIVMIVFFLTAVALASKNVPPAAFLLIARYHFYEVSFINGAGGYKLISKRATIDNPQVLSAVTRLFANEYWLLEKEG